MVLITVLEPGENAVLRVPGKFRGTPGTVVLTSRRLLFEQVSGVLSKRTYFLLDLPLEAVQDANVEKKLLRQVLVVTARSGMYTGIPRIEIEVGSLDAVQSTIRSQVATRLNEMEEEKRRSRVQYVVDFSFLKAEMQRGGLVLTTVKCPSCGASVDLPPEGSYLKCAHCGSLIQASDLFERMKGLFR